MSDKSSAHGNPHDAVPAAIAALTEPPDHFPSQVDVANYVNISRNSCTRGSGRLSTRA
jgi:hypothetical protein